MSASYYRYWCFYFAGYCHDDVRKSWIYHKIWPNQETLPGYRQLPIARVSFVSPNFFKTITFYQSKCKFFFGNFLENSVPHSTIGVKPWTNLLTNTSSVCNSVSASQYNSPPVHSLTSSSMYRHQYMLNYQQFPSSSSCGVSNSIASSFDDCSMQNVPETHKSMWVLNPLYASTSGKKTVTKHSNDR